MKNHKEIAEILDSTLDKMINEEIDHKRGSTIARLTGNRIKMAADHIKYKKLTGKPSKIAFFEE